MLPFTLPPNPAGLPPCLASLLLGLAAGSFLNVCIHRMPRGESVVHPRSRCPHCGRSIHAWDNIPVLSWILLRARCRACGQNISPRYPMVEIATAALFLGCWLRFHPVWVAAFWALFCFLLLGLSLMDAESFLLPDRFTLPGLFLGLIFDGARGFAAAGPGSGRFALLGGLRAVLWASLEAAAAAGLLLLLMGAYWLLRRRAGMGGGDVKLTAMLVAWLGPALTALAFFAAVAAGALYGLALIAARRRRATPALPPTAGPNPGSDSGPTMIPFGAFLSAAALYSLFAGGGALRWYLRFFP